MKSTEDAYMSIAMGLTESAKIEWSNLKLNTKILGKDCSSMVFICSADNEDVYLDPSFENVFAINDACIYLRDHLLATTGDRIWGLTFTLHPDGQFKIEYDYNKPEGYEETDETITWGEASQELPLTTSPQR